jgi:hypothetical protein
MQPRLKTIFDSAERDRLYILSVLSETSAEKFAQRINNQWSASQILSHIIQAEQISLQYMKKKFLGISNSDNTGLWEEITSNLLKISQRLPLKFKAPKVLGENDPSSLSFDELKSQWDGCRAELSLFLENFHRDLLKKKIYKHPVAGRLNILQAVSFMREHVGHHLPQIKSRIL